jgi:hypothetical protein
MRQCQLGQLLLCIQTAGNPPYICPYVAFLYLPLNSVIYARCLLSKDTNMSASFEEKRELMLMTSPSPVTKSDGKMEVKAMLCFVALLADQSVGWGIGIDVKIMSASSESQCLHVFF